MGMADWGNPAKISRTYLVQIHAREQPGHGFMRGYRTQQNIAPHSQCLCSGHFDIGYRAVGNHRRDKIP
jgi:hypothetical protein